MGWLDANEYFLMEAVARDRHDDIRRASGVSVKADAGPHARDGHVGTHARRGGDPMTDRELVELLRSGEPMGTDRLVAGYGDRAYRLANAITGSGRDAEAAVQDAFWTIIHGSDRLRDDRAFGSWLDRIVARTAYQKLRARLPARNPEIREHDRGGAVLDWSGRVDDPALQAGIRRVLVSAMNELPADDRAALVLADVEGLPTDEVGALLGVSPVAVASRVHRARLLLRERLAAYMSSAPAADCVA